MSAVDTIINQALAIADAQSTDVQTYTEAAQTAAGGLLTYSNTSPPVPDPIAVEPDVYIPEKLDRSKMSTDYDRIYNELIAMAANKIGSFLVDYFPILNDAYDEATAWLVDTITNGGTGIPAVIEDQIWQRGRDRLVTDNLRAQESAAASFATRGFSMPSGAMTALYQEIRYDGLAKSAEFSRDVAIKQIEIEIENIRFAVKTAIDARVAAINAAIDYIRALMIAPEVASQYAFRINDLQAALINAVANFYNARLNRDELTIKAAMANNDISLRAFATTTESYKASLDARVEAAVGAARAAGDTAAAALGSINGIASKTEQI
jgi:hypothetical protein